MSHQQIIAQGIRVQVPIECMTISSIYNRKNGPSHVQMEKIPEMSKYKLLVLVNMNV